MKLGSKENSGLNGEWGKHAKSHYKALTSRKRRANDKKVIKKELE